MILLEIGDEEQALLYMDKAMALRNEVDLHPEQIGSIQNSRGIVLQNLKRYEEALAAYEVAY